MLHLTCSTVNSVGPLQNSATLLGAILYVRHLPARLSSEQTAALLGFQDHDIPVLVRASLLKPVGGEQRNCVKYFARFEIENLALDRKWLDRASRAVRRTINK